MQHEKFAKRAAERLEAEADRLEEKSQWMKLDVTAARANELRVAAHTTATSSPTGFKVSSTARIGAPYP